MTGFMHEKEFSRKTFLKGGGALVVGFSIAGSGLAGRASAAPPGATLPIPLDQVDSYLTVHPDNTATLYHSIVEHGQGTHTGLLQIAAEELDMSLSQMKQAVVDTATSPNTGTSSASAGLLNGGSYVRAAAATARQALLALAATNLGVSATNLTVKDGVVSGAGRSVTYGQLIGGKLFNVTIPSNGTRDFFGNLAVGMGPGDPGAKPVSQYNLVTKSMPRIDIPAIVTGSTPYISTLRLPGMLHGRIVRPRGQSHYIPDAASLSAPFFIPTQYEGGLYGDGGQAVVAIDESSIKHLKDVQIVRKGNFIGVVAPDEWMAVQAAAQLKVTWAKPSKPLPGNGNLVGAIERSAGTQGPDRWLTGMGDVNAGLSQASKTVSATFTTPYIINASLGPNISIADVTPTGVTLYNKGSGFGYTNVNSQVADALGVNPASVRGITYPSSSSYGTSTEMDSPIAAAVLSQAVGKPVRLQFMRWDDEGYGLAESAEVVQIRAGIDAKGNLTAFDYVGMNHVLVATSAITTGGVYTIPNRKVTIRPTERLFPGVSMRSVSDRAPLFATEQVIDELAHIAGMDPIAFRRQNMTGNAYWLEVLDAIAKAAKWESRPAASNLSDANIVRGRGVSLGTHLSGGGPQGLPNLDWSTVGVHTQAGAIAEIEVNKKTGKITVKHLYAAISPGLVVNPELVTNQVIGQQIMGTSNTFEEYKFNTSNATSLDWVSYPIQRFKDHPNVTPIVIQSLNRPHHGAGEETLANVAPAVANAFFDATGVRLRQLPLTPAVVRKALTKAGIS